ncbi:Na(+)/H(+) antiporter NhaD [Thalassocella blandensis]|nr:Na(+)/H(+) antiporter NhaD [Thalassocella blandensis]
MPAFLPPILLGLSFLALLGIVFEEVTHVNKAKVTLFFGTFCWVLLYAFSPSSHETGFINSAFNENMGEIASLWLFLVASMTFVAYLNKKGMIENLIYLFMPKRVNEKALLFLTALFCFVFSSLADNITATLVSITLILSLKLDKQKTIRFATLVVFAVNSGGVALITGDVTTLMIFLAGKIQITELLLLILPAFIAVMTLAAIMSFGLSGTITVSSHRTDVRRVDIVIAAVFLLTILATIVGNIAFQLPPALTFLMGLSIMFLIARFYHDDEERDAILDYIRTIEFDTLLFFLGILLIVGMLKEIHILDTLASHYAIVPDYVSNYVIGFISAIIDNVPLTAALLKSDITMSKPSWMGLTYAVGAGGSLFIIGSAAGIVAMSKIKGLTFVSHLRYLWMLTLAYTIGYGGVYLVGNLLLK